MAKMPDRVVIKVVDAEVIEDAAYRRGFETGSYLTLMSLKTDVLKSRDKAYMQAGHNAVLALIEASLARLVSSSAQPPRKTLDTTSRQDVVSATDSR